MTTLTFKLATEPWELEGIHRLNYDTFVGEIPQHAANDERRLVDKFHAENTYCVGLDGQRVVAMVCLRGNRPFSLDQKLPDLDSFLPPARRICEVRLLAVERAFRHTRTTARLLALLAREALERGFDCAVISGTTRQTKLYRHLGFTPFGPLVGTGDALFQPMFLTLEALERHAASVVADAGDPGEGEPVGNFLPGPVSVQEPVATAFARRPVSHRSARFLADVEAVRRELCALTRAADVQILLGSGTMANEAVAAHLAALDAPGLILSSGEFGERLVDHARRQGLSFDCLRCDWGHSFPPQEVARFLDQHPQASWVWCVHCETSTGVLNDLGSLSSACTARGLKLCVDAISSIGVVSVDLEGVYLASGVSGKGLASYPGLAVVFHRDPLVPNPRIPRYLDVGYYAVNQGVPFTQSSNLVYALQAALAAGDWQRKFARLEQSAAWLRQELRAQGWRILADDTVSSPAVTTLVLPEGWGSRSLGWRLERSGLLLSYRSEYLLRRNWMQLCLMGAYSETGLQALLARLGREPLLGGEVPQVAEVVG